MTALPNKCFKKEWYLEMLLNFQIGFFCDYVSPFRALWNTSHNFYYVLAMSVVHRKNEPFAYVSSEYLSYVENPERCSSYYTSLGKSDLLRGSQKARLTTARKPKAKKLNKLKNMSVCEKNTQARCPKTWLSFIVDKKPVLKNKWHLTCKPYVFLFRLS